MILWDSVLKKSKGCVWALSDIAPWMRLRVFCAHEDKVETSTWEALRWVFLGLEGVDEFKRLDTLDVRLERNQYHAVSWVHRRTRTKRGYVRSADVYIKQGGWPAEMSVIKAAVNPGVGELVGARITGGKKPWWRYEWEKVQIKDEPEAIVFGVAQAAWYCLRKEKSIKEGVPGYPAAARHGIEWLEDWRAGKEPTRWL